MIQGRRTHERTLMRIGRKVMGKMQTNDDSLISGMPATWLNYLVSSVGASVFRKNLRPATLVAENMEPFREVGTALRRRFCRLGRN